MILCPHSCPSVLITIFIYNIKESPVLQYPFFYCKFFQTISFFFKLMHYLIVNLSFDFFSEKLIFITIHKTPVLNFIPEIPHFKHPKMWIMWISQCITPNSPSFSPPMMWITFVHCLFHGICIFSK